MIKPKFIIMVHYNINQRTFEFHTNGSILTCFSMKDLIIQVQRVYNINILTILN